MSDTKDTVQTNEVIQKLVKIMNVKGNNKILSIHRTNPFDIFAIINAVEKGIMAVKINSSFINYSEMSQDDFFAKLTVYKRRYRFIVIDDTNYRIDRDIYMIHFKKIYKYIDIFTIDGHQNYHDIVQMLDKLKTYRIGILINLNDVRKKMVPSIQYLSEFIIYDNMVGLITNKIKKKYSKYLQSFLIMSFKSSIRPDMKLLGRKYVNSIKKIEKRTVENNYCFY